MLRESRLSATALVLSPVMAATIGSSSPFSLVSVVITGRLHILSSICTTQVTLCGTNGDFCYTNGVEWHECGTSLFLRDLDEFRKDHDGTSSAALGPEVAHDVVLLEILKNPECAVLRDAGSVGKACALKDRLME